MYNSFRHDKPQSKTLSTQSFTLKAASPHPSPDTSMLYSRKSMQTMKAKTYMILQFLCFKNIKKLYCLDWNKEYSLYFTL